MKGGVRSALQAFSALFSADLGMKLVGVALLAFYTRHLTKEELALLPIYDMLSTLSLLVFSFGVFPTLLRRLPAALERNPDHARALATTGFRLAFLSACGSAALAWTFADTLGSWIAEGQDAGRYLRLMALGFPAVAARRAAEQVLWASSRFSGIARVWMARTVGSVLCAGLLLWIGLEGLVLGLVARDWIAAGVGHVLARDLFANPFRPSYPTLRLVRESVPFYLEAYVLYLRAEGDQWLVATYLGAGPLGTYYIARRVYGFLFGAFQSADRIVATSVLRRREDSDAVGQLLTRLLVLFSQTGIPAAFLVFGLTPTLITVIAGPTSQGAVVPSILLSLLIVIYLAQAPLSRGVFAVNRPRDRLAASVLESVLLVGSLAVLTPRFGLVGVGSARVLSALATSGFLFWLVRRVVRFQLPIRAVGTSVLLGAAMAAALLAGQERAPELHMVPLYTAAAVAAYLALSWLLNRRAVLLVWREFRPTGRAAPDTGS